MNINISFGNNTFFVTPHQNVHVNEELLETMVKFLRRNNSYKVKNHEFLLLKHGSVILCLHNPLPITPLNVPV